MATPSYAELADVLERLPSLVLEARIARGVSLREAARQAGVPYVNLHRIESGEGGSTTGTLVLVLRWLADQ